MVTDVSACSIPVIKGAGGEPSGVTAVEVVADPKPSEFTARNCTLYSVPLARPGIISGLVVPAGERVCQVEPPFVEYW